MNIELQKAIVPLGLVIATISLLIVLTVENKVTAWHGELGLTGERAGELWRSNPSDPAITTWRLQLQNTVDDAILVCDSPNLPIIPAGKDGKITKEQIQTDKFLRQSQAESCKYLVDIVIQQCSTHAVMQPIACEHQRIKEYSSSQSSSQSVSPKPSQQKKLSPQEKEQQLIDLCAQVIYEKRQSPLCQDLTPEVKQKVQTEAQKLGGSDQNTPPKTSPQEDEEYIIASCMLYFYVPDKPQHCENLTPELKQKVQNEFQNLGDSDQNILPKPSPQEEEPWEIGFCAKRVYYSNHLPTFCEDQPQEKIEFEVQKLEQQFGIIEHSEAQTTIKNNEDEDEDDNRDEDNDDKQD